MCVKINKNNYQFGDTYDRFHFYPSVLERLAQFFCQSVVTRLVNIGYLKIAVNRSVARACRADDVKSLLFGKTYQVDFVPT